MRHKVISFLKAIKVALYSLPAIRKIRYRRTRRGIVILQKMANFEEACFANIAQLSTHDYGLWYLGRFDGTAHHFVCVDRTKLRRLSSQPIKAFIHINGKRLFWRTRLRRAIKNPKRTGLIEIYQMWISTTAVPFFGRREAVKIHVPREEKSTFWLAQPNPVARELFKNEETIDVRLGKGLFTTPKRFLKYEEADKRAHTKVDLVYTWVDGTDNTWSQRKNKYLSALDKETVNPTAISSSRFKHINELLYSVRSALMYTNFVRHIYIVTDQQTPAWLKQYKHISVIDHKEIFPDPIVLPTFNSHAIETCLHRIPGLQEHFLYLNDDFLFTRSVTLHQFFTPNFYPRLNWSRQTFIPPSDASPIDLPVDSAAKNARHVFAELFGVWITRKTKHVPCPVNKTLLQELIPHLKYDLTQTRQARFRSHKDISLLTCTYYHWADLQGKAGPGTLNYGYLDVNRRREMLRLYIQLTRSPEQRWDVLCINDVDDSYNDPTARKWALHALNTAFPLPSALELTDN